MKFTFFSQVAKVEASEDQQLVSLDDTKTQDQNTTVTDVTTEKAGADSKAVVEWTPPVITSYEDLAQLLPPCWLDVLHIASLDWWKTLKAALQKRKEAGATIFPPINQTFRAFNLCPADVRVVLIAQDPYFNVGEATGHCFSVPRGVKIPSSLRNIYKELSDDIPNFKPPKHGDLSSWAAQGVFLLNASLTVELKQPNVHANLGWARFTDMVVDELNKRKNLVWLLWGSFAQKKARNVDKSKHLVLMAPHPSGLSAHRGFFGAKPFSQCNAYLKAHNLPAIDWCLPE